MSAVDTAITEVVAAIEEMAPAHEGLRDYARLNIEDATREVVNTEIARYDRRRALLVAANNAMVDLVNDGHPNLDAAEISQAALEDLRKNESTIEAALGKFKANTASGLGLAGGTAETK